MRRESRRLRQPDADDTEPWQETTRIVGREDAHDEIDKLKLLRYEVSHRERVERHA
jgi:hypothetical protein